MTSEKVVGSFHGIRSTSALWAYLEKQVIIEAHRVMVG